MAVVHRFRVVLNGWPGAPGINTFWALAPGELQGTQASVNDFRDQLNAMYTALKTYQPAGVAATILPDVDVFDVADGSLTNRMALPSGWTVTMTDAISNTSRATMAKFRYKTDRIWRNRVVSGGIFFGPLSDAAVDGAGAITSAFSSAVTTAHNGLLDIVGDLRLAIWSQPPQGGVGTYGYVQNVSVMPLPAVLRSRRD